MIPFLLCIVGACILIGALRGYKKHRYDMRAPASAVVKGAIDGLLIGILIAAVTYCAWQVFKFWIGLVVLGWIFWPKHHRSSS